ncbi:MAG: NifU family protein [Eubacterium sp.]
MKIQQYIENVLQPKIQGDGGWIEFVSLDGDELTVIFAASAQNVLF